MRREKDAVGSGLLCSCFVYRSEDDVQGSIQTPAPLPHQLMVVNPAMLYVGTILRVLTALRVKTKARVETVGPVAPPLLVRSPRF